jgi:hypothetical protein
MKSAAHYSPKTGTETDKERWIRKEGRSKEKVQNPSLVQRNDGHDNQEKQRPT